jgi:hypothetical protein
MTRQDRAHSAATIQTGRLRVGISECRTRHQGRRLPFWISQRAKRGASRRLRFTICQLGERCRVGAREVKKRKCEDEYTGSHLTLLGFLFLRFVGWDR